MSKSEIEERWKDPLAGAELPEGLKKFDESLKVHPRRRIKHLPNSRGETPRPVKSCRLCTLREELSKEGRSQEEIEYIEASLYRMIYSFWDLKDILSFLNDEHGMNLGYTSLYRHVTAHIPDPDLALLNRIRSYRPQHMNGRFMHNVAETMRLALMKFREELAQGNIKVTTSDFVRIAELYKEWSEDLAGDPEGTIMLAIERTISEVMGEEERSKFIAALRKNLEELDETQ